MTEADLLSAIQLECSRGECRLFRANAGLAWQGEIIQHTKNHLILGHARAIRLGIPGMSDLIGWSDDDGRAVYTAIEGKIGYRKATAEQRAFIELVLASGGRAGVAYSVEQAKEILTL